MMMRLLTGLALAVFVTSSGSVEALAQQVDCGAERGWVALDEQDTDTAIREFEAVLPPACPENLLLLKILANLHYARYVEHPSDTTALSAAKRYVYQAARLAPEDFDVLRMQAALRANEGDFTGSEALYLQMLGQPNIAGGERIALLGELGALYVEWKKYDLAEAKLTEALKVPEDHTVVPFTRLEAYATLGKLYEQTDRKAEAIPTYREAIAFAREVPQEAMDSVMGAPVDSSGLIGEMESHLSALEAAE